MYLVSHLVMKKYDKCYVMQLLSTKIYSPIYSTYLASLETFLTC